MDSQFFGKIALELLENSQIPGASLEQALEFKKAAIDLANGETELAPKPEK